MSVRLFCNKELRQFISYFCVGGVAALVEWTAFFCFANILYIQYLVSTLLAFIVSTSVNWVLGRAFTFKDSAHARKGREAALVFLVSGIGLLFNIILMYLLVSVMGLDSEIQKTASKIFSTGIVFIWNFLLRKYYIYR